MSKTLKEIQIKHAGLYDKDREHGTMKLKLNEGDMDKCGHVLYHQQCVDQIW